MTPLLTSGGAACPLVSVVLTLLSLCTGRGILTLLTVPLSCLGPPGHPDPYKSVVLSLAPCHIRLILARPQTRNRLGSGLRSGLPG